MNKITAFNQPQQQRELSEVDNSYPEYSEGVYTEEYPESAAQEDEKHLLKSLFSTLRRHWFLIISLNLLVTAISVIYVAQKPNYFQSEARVQVNGEINPALNNNSGSSSVIVSSPGADPAYFATQLQILEGSGLMRRVIKTLDLQNNQEFLNPQGSRRLGVWQNVMKMLGFYRAPDTAEKLRTEIASASDTLKNDLTLKNDSQTETAEEAERLAPYVNLLKNNLKISPVKDSRTTTKETRLIDIEYTHQDPDVAAKIANAVGDAYVLQNLEQKVLSNASAGDFLQKRVAELQSEIRQGEERLMNYARTNQIISLDANQNTVVQRLSALNTSLGQAVNDRITAQTAYQAALQNPMWNAGAEKSDPQVANLEGQISGLRQKLVQLKTEYTDDWFEVVQTKKQIENLEGQLKTISKRASGVQIADLQEKLNEAVAREKLLRDNFDLQRGEVVRQNEASINYKIIQQEIDTNKSLLNGLLQRSKENEIVLTGTQNNVLVLDRALVPNSPAGPERLRSIFVAFIASLGLGLGLAFLIDWLNDTVNHTQDIETVLGLPLLASVPAAPLKFSQKLLPQTGFAIGRKAKRLKRHYNQEAFEKPQFMETYMQLGTYLMLSTAGGPPRTVLVTSGEEGEGKTMTALNLATSLAKTKGKILIIDADLRCPRIHKIKDLSNKVGLTTLLAMNEISPETIVEAIQKDPHCNLDILTSGEHSLNPGNLLSSKEMAGLLKKLSGTYSHIIIDSPPVLYFADSAIISTLVDAVILVVRDNKSSKTSVVNARKTLQKVGARVIGLVLNGVPLQKTNYYNYSYYEANEPIGVDKGSEILKIH